MIQISKSITIRSYFLKVSVFSADSIPSAPLIRLIQLRKPPFVCRELLAV